MKATNLNLPHVLSIDDFITKYGTHGHHELIAKFVSSGLSADALGELAKDLGRMSTHLESALCAHAHCETSLCDIRVASFRKPIT